MTSDTDDNSWYTPETVFLLPNASRYALSSGPRISIFCLYILKNVGMEVITELLKGIKGKEIDEILERFRKIYKYKIENTYEHSK